MVILTTDGWENYQPAVTQGYQPAVTQGYQPAVTSGYQPAVTSGYQLLDSGDGQKLEKFGQFTLIRPDPQIIWKKSLPPKVWAKADAIFKRISEEKGQWEFRKKLPQKWLCRYKNLSYWVKLSPFKHTGVFPEQSIHWDFIQNSLTSHPNSQVLNLFGYTGLASLAAAIAGAKVTHVDASYPTIGWARQNQQASNLQDKPIRWILDDVTKFCEREAKRGVKYDGIIMDPPAYGHGPKGETWRFNQSFPNLLEIISQLLSEKPLFVIVNAYAISSSAITLENALKDYLKNCPGKFETGELAIKEQSSGKLLSAGIFSRWSSFLQ